MGYIDNTEITVDAVITKKGRQKLASGQSLNITKFALSDDDIDYSLYNPTHKKGPTYYDSAITSMPITEASCHENLEVIHKLVTLAKNTTKIPVVTLNTSLISIYQNEGGVDISPKTSPDVNKTLGYTVVLANKSAGTISVTLGSKSESSKAALLVAEASSTAQVVTGERFLFTPNPNLKYDLKTTIIVYGNETGGCKTIPVTIKYRETA